METSYGSRAKADQKPGDKGPSAVGTIGGGLSGGLGDVNLNPFAFADEAMIGMMRRLGPGVPGHPLEGFTDAMLPKENDSQERRRHEASDEAGAPVLDTMQNPPAYVEVSIEMTMFMIGGDLELAGALLKGAAKALSRKGAKEGVPLVAGVVKKRAARGTGLVDDAARAASKACFAAGTLVLTPDGLVRIENIDEGDLVWARHDESGEEDWKAVTEVFITADREILDLEFEDEDGRVQRLRLTPEHPLWSVTDGWKWAGDLIVGEQIDSLSGPLTLLAAMSVAEPQMVFNLEVDGFHTYFVGESGVWAHNNCFDRIRRVNGLPKNARLSSDVDDVFGRLSRNHGIDPNLASQRLHQLKKANGFGGADNVVFDMTGNVFNPNTGELMGSLTQGGTK